MENCRDMMGSEWNFRSGSKSDALHQHLQSETGGYHDNQGAVVDRENNQRERERVGSQIVDVVQFSPLCVRACLGVRYQFDFF